MGVVSVIPKLLTPTGGRTGGKEASPRPQAGCNGQHPPDLVPASTSRPPPASTARVQRHWGCLLFDTTGQATPRGSPCSSGARAGRPGAQCGAGGCGCVSCIHPSPLLLHHISSPPQHTHDATQRHGTRGQRQAAPSLRPGLRALPVAPVHGIFRKGHGRHLPASWWVCPGAVPARFRRRCTSRLLRAAILTAQPPRPASRSSIRAAMPVGSLRSSRFHRPVVDTPGSRRSCGDCGSSQRHRAHRHG